MSFKGKYTVIRDTREKPGKGWTFRETEYCTGTIEQKLDVGDYSIVGYEKIFTIERKGSVTELCKNLIETRFLGDMVDGKPLEKQSEFVRLQAIPYPFLLLEFDMAEFISFPFIDEVPKSLRYKMRMKGYMALKILNTLQFKYKTQIIFAGRKHGQEVASSLFKRCIEEHAKVTSKTK